MGQDIYNLFILFGAGIVLFLYFTPSLVAFNRNHAFRWIILVMNFIPVLWVPSFVWSIWPRNTTVFGSDLVGQQVSKHEAVLSSDKYSIQDKLDLLTDMYYCGDITKEEFVARKLKLTEGEERA